jgi:hypothetical protein
MSKLFSLWQTVAVAMHAMASADGEALAGGEGRERWGEREREVSKDSPRNDPFCTNTI